MTENLLSVCLRGVLKVWCGRPREQGGEGRGGLEALSGQNGLCSTGRPRTGWVDADDAGSRVRVLSPFSCHYCPSRCLSCSLRGLLAPQP